MTGFVPEFDSEYIIDGTKMDMTPGQMLREATGRGDCLKDNAEPAGEPFIDESVDPAPDDTAFDASGIYGYLDLTSGESGKPRNIPAFCSDEVTRTEIVRALTEAIWKTGHFRIDDLVLELTWEWDMEPVGNIAAFYKSVSAACDCLDQLGIRLGGYNFRRSKKECHIKVNVSAECLHTQMEDDEPLDIAETIDREIMNTPDMNPAMPGYDFPFRTENPVIGRRRKCPEHISGDKSDWLIYMPFDTCKFRLGGSLLAERTGRSGGKSVEMEDTDYFMDCFEVVREFVEDGIIVSGTSVGPGGIACAMGRMAGKTAEECTGIDADISGICRSYSEKDIVRILFGEVPGVLIEVRDSDFDYIDAELLLQDVAYYPIGHPGEHGLRIASGGQDGVAGILQALMGQEDIVPEGED